MSSEVKLHLDISANGQTNKRSVDEASTKESSTSQTPEIATWKKSERDNLIQENCEKQSEIEEMISVSDQKAPS